MIRILLIVLVFLFSCSQPTANNERATQSEEVISSEISDSIGVVSSPENELFTSLRGDWISTILTDSILANKKILPWRYAFYGDLLISVYENDSALWCGNMDGALFPYKIKDENSIELITDYGNTKLTHDRKGDFVYLGNKSDSRNFKRIVDDKMRSIVRNDSVLMQYIISLLFTNEYLTKEEISNIDYISLGLETYTPFDFDAIGIKDGAGEIEYFGWLFKEDTLELYKTTFTYDDDSGFKEFEKGELDRIYVSNKAKL